MRHLVPLSLLLLILASVSLRAPQAQSAQDPPIERFEDYEKLQKQIQAVVAKVRGAVVGVRMSNSSGSGSFISADGWVCTAGHVSETKPGTKCTIIAHGGKSYEGVVYGSDMAMDHGLIKVDTKGEKVPFIELGDSDKVKNGQWIILMGHPLGIESGRDAVVRAGRVLAAKNRVGFITTDAPVIHGDSGGPALDLSGKQIAINQSIDGMDARVNNVTPIALFKKQLDDMKANKILHPVTGQPRFGRGIASDGLTEAERDAYGRAMQLHGEKRWDAAAKLVEPFANKKGLNDEILYNIACIYAMLSTTLKGKEAEELQKKAVQYLEKSVEAGNDNADWMRKDPDLDCLRARKDYLAAEQLAGKASVKALLGLSVRATTGIRVSEVIPGSPADRAGLQKDDVITKIGKVKVADAQEYVDLLLFTGIAADTDVTVSRKSKAPAIKLYLPPLGAKAISSGGAQITEVADDSVAYKAGLKVGDVITQVGAVKIKTSLDFANALLCADAKRPIQLSYKRGYEKDTLGVAFATSEAAAATSNFKQGEGLLRLWDKVTARFQDAVFSVKQKGKQVSYATAIDPRGYLLCKASEIFGGEKIVLISRSGAEVAATLVASDVRTDLALLKAAQALPSAVKFENMQTGSQFPNIGELICTLDENGHALAQGFVALPPFDTDKNARPSATDAVMGMGGKDAKDGGVIVENVTKGAPAEKAGLKTGDVIRAVDGEMLKNWEAFVALMRSHKPGDTLELVLERAGKPEKVSVTLVARKDIQGGGAPDTAPKGTGKPELGIGSSSPANPGLRIDSVRDGTPAELAGLTQGDVILEADGKAVNEVRDLATVLDTKKPGEKLKIKFARDGKTQTIDIELAEQMTQPEATDAQHKGPVSARADKFGVVIQHDGLLAPRQMGSPIIDLKGNVLGINVARSDRTRNFAIPAARVADVIAKLMKEAEGK